MLSNVRSPRRRRESFQPRARIAQQFGDGRLDVRGLNAVERHAKLDGKQGIRHTGTRHFLSVTPPGEARRDAPRAKSYKTVTIERNGFRIERGACAAPCDGERLNVFALVIYIPPPLGSFLDDLRRELVPHYNPHAHVSVLPPRPLGVDWQTASEQARSLTEGWAPFDVELTTIEVFPQTDVIYIEIGAGASELDSLHCAMNSSRPGFPEPYPYHPHITLAQEIRARDGWTRAGGTGAPPLGGVSAAPAAFRAERAVFVQNTADNCWVDLAEYSLGAVRGARNPATEHSADRR